jgi:hypothetical protein
MGISSNINNNVNNRILTATGGDSIDAEPNLTYNSSSFTIFNSNYNGGSTDSGSTNTGLRLDAGEGFSIYGNQNFFAEFQDAIIFQMEDVNAFNGATDGGFVFRGYSPTGTSPVAQNWMVIKSGGLVGIGTLFPQKELHVQGQVFAFGYTGSLNGTASFSDRSNFATITSQSIFSISASYASRSLSASYAPFTQTYQVNTISSSYASSSLSSSFALRSITSSFALTASKIEGGLSNYVAKWFNNNTLTTGNIVDNTSLVSILSNIKHTGSIYRDYLEYPITHATNNNKWLRIARFNQSETLLDAQGGYLTPAKFTIVTIPNSSVGASNRGNVAEISVINSGFSGQASIAINNAYVYGTAMATKIRTSKSGSALTWYIDAYIENISSSATLDVMQVILTDGKMTLMSELDPVVGLIPTETNITYPGVHNVSTADYGFRVEGNKLLVSSSIHPLKLIGVQTGTDSEFLTINSSGVVRKSSTIPTASLAISASFAPFTQTYQVNTLSSSWASSSLRSIQSTYATSSGNSNFTTTASWASQSYYANTAGNADTLDGFDSTYFQPIISIGSTLDIGSRIIQATSPLNLINKSSKL